MIDFFSWLLTDGPSYLWKMYNKNNEQVNGILSSLTVLMTTVVLFFTARAANAAKNSTIIARESLNHAKANSKRDEFVRRFTIYLDLHNEQLNIVKKYLDLDGKDFFEKVVKAESLTEACNIVRSNSTINPYMRMLYNLLEYVDSSSSNEDEFVQEKKEYTSIVRSLIRNDVLFLVAVNASHAIEDGKENDYAKYQRLLHEFGFFEYSYFFKIRDVDNGNDLSILNNYFIKLQMKIEMYYSALAINISRGKPKPEKPKYNLSVSVIISCIFNNPTHQRVVEYVDDLMNGFEGRLSNAIENRLNILEPYTTEEHLLSSFRGARYIDTSPAKKKKEGIPEITNAEFECLHKVDFDIIERLILKYGEECANYVYFVYKTDEYNPILETPENLYIYYSQLLQARKEYKEFSMIDLKHLAQEDFDAVNSIKDEILNQRIIK